MDSLSSHHGTAALAMLSSRSSALLPQANGDGEMRVYGAVRKRFPDEGGFNSLRRRLTEDQAHRARHDERVARFVRASARSAMLRDALTQGGKAIGSYWSPLGKKCDLTNTFRRHATFYCLATDKRSCQHDLVGRSAWRPVKAMGVC